MCVLCNLVLFEGRMGGRGRGRVRRRGPGGTGIEQKQTNKKNSGNRES